MWSPHAVGALVSLAVLAPNVLFMVLPPRANVKPVERSSLVLDGIENLGPVGCMLLPAILGVSASSASPVILTGMAISIAFYYAGWARYFWNESDYCLLFGPMAGIPLPMAVAPIAWFALTAVLMHSWMMWLAVVLFAVGHILVSSNTHGSLHRDN